MVVNSSIGVIIKNSESSLYEINFGRRLACPSTTQRVYINKDQYFEGISKEVWEYRIGAYQVMEKYLKDRKGRKLSLDEINHYMKVARAIHLSIGLQDKVQRLLPPQSYHFVAENL